MDHLTFPSTVTGSASQLAHPQHHRWTASVDARQSSGSFGWLHLVDEFHLGTRSLLHPGFLRILLGFNTSPTVKSSVDLIQIDTDSQYRRIKRRVKDESRTRDEGERQGCHVVFASTATMSQAAERRLSQEQFEPTIKCASCHEARNVKTACTDTKGNLTQRVNCKRNELHHHCWSQHASRGNHYRLLYNLTLLQAGPTTEQCAQLQRFEVKIVRNNRNVKKQRDKQSPTLPLWRTCAVCFHSTKGSSQIKIRLVTVFKNKTVELGFCHLHCIEINNPSPQGGRCHLVMVPIETGCRWREETVKFTHSLADARSREAPTPLQRSVFLAWREPWARKLAFSANRTFAGSVLSSCDALEGVEGATPDFASATRCEWSLRERFLKRRPGEFLDIPRREKIREYGRADIKSTGALKSRVWALEQSARALEPEHKRWNQERGRWNQEHARWNQQPGRWNEQRGAEINSLGRWNQQSGLGNHEPVRRNPTVQGWI